MDALKSALATFRFQSLVYCALSTDHAPWGGRDRSVALALLPVGYLWSILVVRVERRWNAGQRGLNRDDVPE
jgi:hypothetical protein